MKKQMNSAFVAEKKSYIIPACTTTSFFEGMTALCASATEGMSIITGDEQEKARAPRRLF